MLDSEPVIITYMQEFYDALKAASKDGIFEGSLVHTYRSLGISSTHYSLIQKVLRESGCIEVIRLGRSTHPSKIRLHRRPTVEDFDETYRKVLTLRANTDIVQLVQRVEMLERRVGEVDLGAAFTALLNRIEQLEQTVGGK